MVKPGSDRIPSLKLRSGVPSFNEESSGLGSLLKDKL